VTVAYPGELVQNETDMIVWGRLASESAILMAQFYLFLKIKN
jgi:hypothetical protein